jgi:hypothetical protein
MKTILLSFVIIISAISALAQQYRSFPTHNAVWREVQNISYGSSHYSYDDYQNFINGDTAINGKTYHKIYSSGKSYYYVYNSGSTSYYQNVYKGCIREDSLKHVYLYLNENAHEYLMYDFNLGLGDTLSNNLYGMGLLHSYDPSIKLIVKAIDSVIVGGDYHRRYRFNYSFRTLYLIEGVGSSDGLMEEFDAFPTYYTNLICFKQDSIDAYPYGQACDLVVTGIEEIASEQKIQLFPNPSCGTFTINFKDEVPENAILRISDQLGQTVYEKKLTGGNSHQINAGKIADGIYFIRIQSKEKAYLMKLIINQ